MGTLITPLESGLDSALIRSGAAGPMAESNPEQRHWFALHTRCRHEKQVAAQLHEKGIEMFLPLVREVRRWSDRRKLVETPLFSCYMFVFMGFAGRERSMAVQIPGALRLVGFQDGPAPIPQAEIQAIRRAMAVAASCSPHAFLKTGQKVRIRGGSLDGIEGILVGRHGERRLVISINLIRQSMAVVVEGYDVEPVQ